MTKNLEYIKAGTWYTFSNFISKTLIYICTPFYTRILSPTEYGMYSNYISWQAVLIVLISLDLSTSINNAVLEYKDKKQFYSYITTISLASVLFPLLISFFILINKENFSLFTNIDEKYILILLLYISSCGILQIFQSEQIASVKYKMFSIITMVSALGNLVITLICLYILKDKIFAMIIGNTFFSIVISASILVYYVKRNIDINFLHLKYALYISIPLLPHVLSAIIINSIDKIMITKYCGSVDTALYSIAYIISMALTMFCSSVNKAWLPWFFKQIEINNISVIKEISKKLLQIISCGAILLAVFAPEVIYIVGGDKYRDTIYIMPIIIASSFLLYIYTLYVNVEFYLKKTGAISTVTIICACVNVGLNYIFLPKYGFMAAAITTFFTNLFLLLTHIYIVKKLNMLYVFDNSFIIRMSIFTISICILLGFSYSVDLLHYFSIVVCLLLILFNKSKIISFINDLKK